MECAGCFWVAMHIGKQPALWKMGCRLLFVTGKNRHAAYVYYDDGNLRWGWFAR